jgi:hypothetical protein
MPRTIFPSWIIPSKALMRARRRMPSEVPTLGLEPGSTKNSDGRVVYVSSVLDSALGDLQDVARRLTSSIPGTLAVGGGAVSRNLATPLTGRP